MSTITREFYCDLTDEDIVERSTEQNQLLYEVVKLEAERRAINEAIKPKNERVDELMHIIRNRREKRDVECVWHYDWDRGIKTLHRSDTGEEVERDTIKDHERQGVLSLPSPDGPFFFSNHPRCVYVLSGNVCSSILCGHLPPISPKGSSCSHPIEHHIVESNGVICGICHKVLKKAEITRQLQPAEGIPESIAIADPTDEEPVDVAKEAEWAANQAKMEREAPATPPKTKSKKKKFPCNVTDCVDMRCDGCSLNPATKKATTDDEWPDPPERVAA